MKMKRRRITLILLIVSFLGRTVDGYSKCCGAEEELDYYRKSCVSKSSSKSIKSLTGSQLKSDQTRIGFPETCSTFESLKFSELFAVSESDTLSTPKYRNPIPTESYCLDTYDDKVYAVTCDQCADILCINLCCPFDHGFHPDLTYEYDYSEEYLDQPSVPGLGEGGDDTGIPVSEGTTVANLSETIPGEGGGGSLDYEYEAFNPCAKVETDVRLVLNFTTGDTQVTKEEGKDFIFIGPQEKEEISKAYNFICPIDDIIDAPATWIPYDQEDDKKLSLGVDGILRGVVDHNNRNLEVVKYIDLPPEHYCVSFPSADAGKSDITVMYANCQFNEQFSQCEIVRWHTFNVGFVLSILFIIGAIVAHIIEPQLRDSTFGKISIMYLINLAFQLLIICIDRFADPKVGSTSCIAVGYLLQYFNLSFFCWISGMSFFFFYALENLRPRVPGRSNKFLMWLVGYAQGFPLLMCIITAIVDSVRISKQNASRTDPSEYFDAHSYPEMGEYSCYLGHSTAGDRPSYFTTPEFIYVQAYQLIIMIANLGMFIKTAMYIVKTRAAVRQGDENSNKENFLILLKLFVYMLCVWILEIVTSAINAEYGTNETCVIRFILDLPNAFYGLIIFLVLICSKPPIVKALKRRVSSIWSGANSGGSSKETNYMTDMGHVNTAIVTDDNLDTQNNVDVDNPGSNTEQL